MRGRRIRGGYKDREGRGWNRGRNRGHRFQQLLPPSSTSREKWSSGGPCSSGGMTTSLVGLLHRSEVDRSFVLLSHKDRLSCRVRFQSVTPDLSDHLLTPNRSYQYSPPPVLQDMVPGVTGKDLLCHPWVVGLEEGVRPVAETGVIWTGS